MQTFSITVGIGRHAEGRVREVLLRIREACYSGGSSMLQAVSLEAGGVSITLHGVSPEHFSFVHGTVCGVLEGMRVCATVAFEVEEQPEYIETGGSRVNDGRLAPEHLAAVARQRDISYRSPVGVPKNPEEIDWRAPMQG